jgi:DNA polymerase
MRYVFLDTETRSRTPIEHGNDKYCRDAECLIVTWAYDDDNPAKGVDLADPFEAIPDELDHLFNDPDVVFVAHNAPFDMRIVRFALGYEIPIHRWRCTRAQAYSHGLPGSLETLGIVLGLPQDQQKLVDDGKLIHFFCKPAKDGTWNEPADHLESWTRFYNYALRDTEALRAIWRKLPKSNYKDENLRLWWLNEMINERGFQFDTELAEAAVAFLKKAKEVTDESLLRRTHGAVGAATQRARLLNYLNQKLGFEISNLRASEIREWLEHDDLPIEVRFLLETRLEAGKSSSAKYGRGLRSVGPGKRLRGTIQYGGAGRTGRFSGRGYQPHNMPRPLLAVRAADGSYSLAPVKASFIDNVVIPGILSWEALTNPEVYGGPNEAAAMVLRHSITAAPGNELVVADWKNIESRVLAWVAGQEWKLEAYRLNDQGKGEDLYKLLFSQFFGTPISQINDTERQSGKVAELAFGFGGGVGALVTMAASYNMDLEPLARLVLPRAKPEHLRKAEKAWRRAFLIGEDYALEPEVYMACDVLKQVYRESNDKINQFRYDIDNAVKHAIGNHGEVTVVGRCKVWANSQWLFIELPSGRRLLYSQPRIKTETVQDPDTGKPIYRSHVTYSTARGKSWRREKAWAGLFVENIIQGIAADVLRWSLVNIHEDALTVPAIANYLNGLHEWERSAISLHVHDEPVLDVPVGAYPLPRLVAQMSKGFWWSEGLPLAAEGWINRRYGKR